MLDDMAAPAPWVPAGGLTAPDDAVFVLLLAGVTWLGWAVGRKVERAEAFSLAERRLPWWAAAAALVAAEVSALTVLGLPVAAFREDWTYLQFFVGAAAARVAVAFFFVPAFFSAGAVTPYAWLEGRFGPRTRTAAAGAFAGTRLLAHAVRLLAACVAVGALLGWGPWPTLVLFTAAALVGLARGGAPAAVWTGVFQAALVLLVGLLSIAFLLKRVDGGLGAVWSLTAAAEKLRMVDWGPSPLAPGFFDRFFGDSSPLGPALLLGFLGSAAAFGTDHEQTQKFLSVADAPTARRALLASIAGSLLILLVYLSVGTLLFVYYKQNPGMALPDRVEWLYPHFAVTAMPRVMRGLVLAAVALASVDAPLASLASSYAADLRRLPSGPASLRESRAAAVAFAVAAALLAALFQAWPGALSVALKSGAVCSGPVLAVFGLGLLGTRGGDREALAALAGASVLDLGLLALSEAGYLPVAWGWISVFGTAAAAGLFRWLTRPAPAR